MIYREILCHYAVTACVGHAERSRTPTLPGNNKKLKNNVVFGIWCLRGNFSLSLSLFGFDWLIV